MKKIILLDWSKEWREYVMDTIESMGIEVFLVLDREREITSNVKKVLIIKDLYDNPIKHVSKILNEFGGCGIDAVFTTEDELIQLSNLIAIELGLPSTSSDSIRICMDKYLTRDLISKNGLPTVKYAKVSNVEELRNTVSMMDYPIILKPICSSFSNGISKITNSCQFESAMINVEKASSESPFSKKEYMVEKFISDEGRVITMEVAVQNYNIYPIISTEERQYEVVKDSGIVQYAYDSIIVPSRITDKEEQLLKEQTTKILQLINFKNGMVHAEFKIVNGVPYLIEINPRLIGGFIPEVIKYAKNVDLVLIALDIALGNKITIPPISERSVGLAKCISPRKSGVIKSISGIDEIKKEKYVKKIINNYKKGDQLIFGDTLGAVVILCSLENKEMINSASRQLDELINIDIC